MQVVPRGDQYRGRSGGGEQLLRVGCRVREAELRADVIRAECRIVDDGAQGHAFLQLRQQHGAREVTRADHVDMRNRRLEPLCRGGARLHQRQAWRGGWPGRVTFASDLAVFEDDAGFGGAAFTHEVLINLQGLGKGSAACRQSVQVQTAAAHGLQTGLEVALLGPTDICDRIVGASPFVGRVIAAGPITAREAHFDFLAECVLPR